MTRLGFKWRCFLKYSAEIATALLLIDNILEQIELGYCRNCGHDLDIIQDLESIKSILTVIEKRN